MHRLLILKINEFYQNDLKQSMNENDFKYKQFK